MSATVLPIAPIPNAPARAGSLNNGHLGFIVAWGFCLLLYFGQHALRSAPGVMVPELTSAFGLTILGVSSLLGLYYYTYSTFAFVAGASLGRLDAHTRANYRGILERYSAP